MKTAWIALFATFAAAPAAAQVLADQLTCAQAVAAYERDGVISILANGKFAIPLRPGPPISKARTLQCSAQQGSSVPRPHSVRTKDRRNCVIAVGC